MKIAIVDDNEDDRKRLQEEITKICDNKSRKDFEITEFFSGEDFINLIEKNENKKYYQGNYNSFAIDISNHINTWYITI